MRENLMSGSTGGRWKRGNPAGHLRVPGRCAEKRHHDGLVGTQPAGHLLPRQRSTLLAKGNSTTVFHDLDEFVVERMARLISTKHGHHGRNYGLRVLIDHDYLGLTRLVGSVRHGPAHAVA